MEVIGGLLTGLIGVCLMMLVVATTGVALRSLCEHR